MNLRLGMTVGRSEVLGYAAEALVRAGDAKGARRALDEAMGLATALGERLYLVQLLLLEARLADLDGDRVRTREWIHRALEESQRQGKRWLQLSGLLALCERKDATARDRAALRRALDNLTEGFDTALVRRARTLLRAAHA
jgi:hypothetical protein